MIDLPRVPGVDGRHDCTPLLGILAGGRGSRLGGADKGLLRRDGRSQINWLLATLGVRPADVLISANRNLQIYAATGAEVVADTLPGFHGPLAGIATLLQAAGGRALLTLPVDIDGPVAAAVQALLQALVAEPQHPHVLHDSGGMQPMFAAYPVGLAAAARLRLASADRSMRGWLASIDARACRCAELRLGNLNLPTDLERAGVVLPRSVAPVADE